MRNCPHKGVGGVAQPTRSVVVSTSSTPSLSRGLHMPQFVVEDLGENLVLVEVRITHMH